MAGIPISNREGDCHENESDRRHRAARLVRFEHPGGAGNDRDVGRQYSHSTGAVAPNVSVQATNLATNTSRKALTDGAGNYSIPFLPAGDYTVTVSHPGFQTQKAERFTLQVQQTARLDFKLTVGNVSERVEVSASAAVLQTENATVGTVIDSSKIVDLPLNGRNFIQLAQLIPGVQAGNAGLDHGAARPRFGRTDGSRLRLHGGFAPTDPRDTANRFYIDGIEVDGLRRDDLQLLALGRFAGRVQSRRPAPTRPNPAARRAARST